MVVISLGWGVQSFALAAMSALGMLPRVDAAIHADTTHERAETYDFARRWTPWLEERGVKVITVKGKVARLASVRNDATKSVMIPAFTTWGKDTYVEGGDYHWGDDGEEYWISDDTKILVHRAGDESGQLRRQCTHDWKIMPIRRWLQANRDGEKIEQWLGITLDEVARMKPSRVQYISNEYPFIEYLDRPWTRGMVIKWLVENGLEVPVKSSCVFCPYHDRGTWREIKLSGNGDWQKVLEVDEAIRDKRPGYKCYLAAQRIPLANVDFRSEEDHGQLSLWGEECEGMCFL